MSLPVSTPADPDDSPAAFPTLYELNVRVRLTERARELGRPATLDDLPDEDLDHLADAGFTWLYLLGVWQTGEAGRNVSRTRPDWREEFAAVLPDLTDEDIQGSCFAVTGYTVHEALGGDAALERLRERLAPRGLRLMLDFVPNHTALDHPWVVSRPELYVSGTEEDLAAAPQNYTRVDTAAGERILAHGRDPYFDGWPDTLQLDYSNPETCAAMRAQLRSVASRCEGVRCDMAMLVLPDVFLRTWDRQAQPFWQEAIAEVRSDHPGFTFMAEVYWDREWDLQQLGFSYTYDKRLYDRLRSGNARSVREHLWADPEFQARSARFLENHDEPRAASVFGPDQHRAAAAITFTCPGLRFVHQGQCSGRRVRVPVHLVRAPDEPVDEQLREFYCSLLTCVTSPALSRGQWALLPSLPAWEGNPTHEDVIAMSWDAGQEGRFVVAVNYAGHQSQCYVPLPFPDLAGHVVVLRDRLGPYSYEREGRSLVSPGLYLDVPGWRAHLFELQPSG